MKTLIFSSIMAVLLIGSLTYMSHQPNAYADVASLPQNGQPTNTDVFVDSNASGSVEGVNWTDLRHFVLTGINWQCVNLTTGTGTWTSDAVCAK